MKGMLVLLMVVYHVLNYLQYEDIPHRYMAFLPCSFIMITGILVTKMYLSERGFSFKTVGLRLSVRAMKLVILFTCLNVAARMIWSENHFQAVLNIHAFFKRWFEIYVIGGEQGNNVAFEVLVPIGYTLFFAVLILKIQSIKPYFISYLALFIFGICALMDVYGGSIYNVYLLSAGIVGLALGKINIEVIDRYAVSWKFLAMLLLIYLGIFVFEIDNYVSQITNTCIVLMLIYSIGYVINSGFWFSQLCLLGRYSLMSYIFQILYLQVIKSIEIPSVGPYLSGAFMLMIGTAFFTWISVILVNYGRTKSKTIAWTYSVIFA
jgi:hypothetical protein